MPTLDVPQDSDRHRLSRPVGATSRTRPSGVGKEVVSTLGTVTDGVGGDPGNTVDDHLQSLKNATENVDTLGGLTVTDRAPVANDAILERLADGTFQFNRGLITTLRAAQTASDVSALIDTQVARLVTNTRWKGEWTPDEYAVNDYVTHSSNFYRCTVARSGSDATGPAGDTASWDALSGTELEIVKRLRDVVELLRDRINLTPAAANRGQWPARQPGSEGYQFHNPPMQWHGNWNNSTPYFFGATVVHVDRLWTLTSAGSRTAAKQGDASAPGTDNAWSEVSIGHHLDIPQFQGLWGDLAGHAFKVGDLIDSEGLTYICKMAYTRTAGSSAPAADSQHWDLIDDWVGAIQASTAYHEGATGTYDDELWMAQADIAVDDPEPGAAGNTKWRQITGPTQADLDRLRTDMENQVHSAGQRRGPTVRKLSQPPTVNDPVEVYLSIKSNRDYTAPAALIAGSTDHTDSIGDEIGIYKRTAGTVNRASGVVGTGVSLNVTYYGIFSRAEQDPGNTIDCGRFTHNPMGSVFTHVGVRELSTGQWTPTIGVKQNALILAGGGTELTNFYLKIWNHSGTAQTEYHFNQRGEVHTIGRVNYRTMFGSTLNAAGAFGDIYTNGTDDDDRTIEMAIAASAGGADRYLGNRTIGWLRESQVSESDSNLVFSDTVHTLRLIGSSAYAAITTLPPNTAFFIYDDS